MCHSGPVGDSAKPTPVDLGWSYSDPLAHACLHMLAPCMTEPDSMMQCLLLSPASAEHHRISMRKCPEAESFLEKMLGMTLFCFGVEGLTPSIYTLYFRVSHQICDFLQSRNAIKLSSMIPERWRCVFVDLRRVSHRAWIGRSVKGTTLSSRPGTGSVLSRGYKADVAASLSVNCRASFKVFSCQCQLVKSCLMRGIATTISATGQNAL